MNNQELKSSALYGLKISLLGDSITTFQGFNPENYAVFYEGERAENCGVKKVEDTWWFQVLKELNAELISNDSFSGSLVSGTMFPAGQSDKRIEDLKNDSNESPEAILIYLGVNDFGWLVDVEQIFIPAYEEMIKKIKQSFPEAKIVCFTILDAVVKGHPELRLSQRFDACLDDYNKAIKSIALKEECLVLDIGKENRAYDSFEGVHPTKRGMSEFSTWVLEEIQAMK